MTTAPPTPLAYLDVWSRTARKYRIRAVIMLIVLGMLFAGLCCFTFWLRTGVVAPWEYEDYFELLAQSFRPAGTNQITLSDFLSRPIPVQEVPVHAVIMGLLFASLCSIPILVAILYRLPFAVLFAAMVFTLAAMPWLGITVLAGCLLASMGRIRLSFRYAAALLGLVPTAIYFFTASWEPAGSVSPMAENQALLYAPWVLAILSSCVICAVALAIAKIINFRPGGMPPVLALLFAIPVILFHAYVGRDELEYRILESEYGRGSTSIFAPMDLGGIARQAAIARWTDSSSGSFDDLFKGIYKTTRLTLLRRTEQKRFDAIGRCESFIEQFPTSGHVADVLYLKARSRDFRLNISKLQTDRQAEFRADLPSPASRATWMTLAHQFPTYPGTAVALHNLAVLDAAEGDFDAALEHLETLQKRFGQPANPRAADTGEVGIMDIALRGVTPSAGLAIDVRNHVARGAALADLIRACREDAPRLRREILGASADGSNRMVRPIQLLLLLDDSHPKYRYNLEGIAAAFPDSEANGYVQVRLALLEPDPASRITRLTQVIEERRNHPAMTEALFHLANLLQESNKLDEAVLSFNRLIESSPDSSWAKLADHRLTALRILREEAEDRATPTPADPVSAASG